MEVDKLIFEIKRYVLDKRYEEAIELINKLSDFTINDQLIKWANLYFIYMILGKFDDAGIYFNKIKKENIEILINIGKDAVINFRDDRIPIITKNDFNELYKRIDENYNHSDNE